MTRDELKTYLRLHGLSLGRLCEDIGIAQSTASRWTDRVPDYAEWYARSVIALGHEGADEIRQAMGKSRVQSDAA